MAFSWAAGNAREAFAITVLVLLAAFLAVGFFSLTWRTGDSSRYYVLARSLARGYGYVAPQFIGAPAEKITPPGHPYLHALLMRFVGESMLWGKMLDAGLYVLGVVVVYFLLRLCFAARLPDAVLGTVLSMYTVGLLTMSCWYMAETNYMLFSYLVLLAVVLQSKGHLDKWWWTLLVGVLSGYVYLTRGVGLSLVAAVGLYWLLKRRWVHMISYGAGVLLLVAPWYIRSYMIVGSPDTYIDQLSKMAGSSGGMNYPWWRIFGDIRNAFPVYYFRALPDAVFYQLYYGRNLLGMLHLGWLAPVVQYGFPAVVAGGFFRSLKRWSVVEIYWVLYWLIICSPPMPPQGNWYVYPILPIAALYFIRGVDSLCDLLARRCRIREHARVVRRHGRRVVVMAMALYVVLTAALAASIHFHKERSNAGLHPWAPQRYLNMNNEYMDAWARYVEACQWVGSNAPPSAYISARKIQHAYLFADRRGWRFDVPGKIGFKDVVEPFREYSRSNAIYVVQDQFSGNAVASFAYGNAHWALRELFSSYSNELERVYSTPPPVTHVWKLGPRQE